MRRSHHDARVIVTQLRSGAVRLAAMVATPLVPSDYLDLFDPLRASAPLRARVVDVRPETRDAVTVVFRAGTGWRGHRPGQWIRLGVDVDGVRLWRAYSVTSVPNSDRFLSITVKAVPGGRVSSFLVHRARPGLTVHLDQATGEFVLPEPCPRHALFVTGGSGITPVMGMIRSQLDNLDDVVVVHSSRTSGAFIFGDELRRLAQRDRLRLIERHTGVDGQINMAQLVDLVPDWTERDTWACGPRGLVEALETQWTASGLRERLQVEYFRPPVIRTDDQDGGTVTFERSGTSVSIEATTPLLDIGEDAGVLLPSGCRMGVCFSCLTPLIDGTVRDIRTGELTHAAGGESVLIQPCVSAAAGPCRLDA